MALPSPAVAAVAASPTWGLWARPADRPGQVALALALFLGVVAAMPRGPRRLAAALEFSAVGDLRHVRRFLTVASFAAAFLSLAYIELYLRGGPRAACAPTLWLQGRALSHCMLAWSVPDPSASFRASSLLFTWPDRLAGTSPPGYPLLLAPAFLVGAPMLVGPLLAAANVVATWMLARELVQAAPRSANDVDAEAAGRIAAGLSIGCAALRWATADTVPDGLVALAMTVALAAGLRARRTGSARAFLPAGVAVGVALATAPGSSIAVAVAVAALARCQGAPYRRNLTWALAGALPGLVLLLASNHAAAGRAFASPATVYRAALAFHPATTHARTTALEAFRMARSHLAAIANFEPLALLLAVPLLGKARSRATTAVGCVLAIQAAVGIFWMGKAPVPTDRSWLAALLPIEHALLGVAVVSAFPQRVPVAATLVFAVSLGGFAVHTSHAHFDLAQSDEGHPRFEPDVVREANVTNGLLFFDDDQGFELASDPAASASHGVLAARLHGDDHDRLLFDLLGHPPAHRYLTAAATPSVMVWTPSTTSGDAWRFEAEADFPPSRVAGGRVEVVDGAGMCPADARALALEPGAQTAEASMTIELPSPRGSIPAPARTWRVIPRVFLRGGPGEAEMTLVERAGGPPLAHWAWKDASNGPACVELGEQTLALGPESRRTWLVVTAKGGAVALDKTVLRAR